MNTNGTLTLAKALTSLANNNINTQVIAEENAMTSVTNDLSLTQSCTKKLDQDRAKAEHAAQFATLGSGKYEVEAAEAHEQYEIDSTKMNNEMGQQNAVVNKTNLTEHMQEKNLKPLFDVMTVLTSMFYTVSGIIINFNK